MRRRPTKADEYQIKKKIILYGVRTTNKIFDNIQNNNRQSLIMKSGADDFANQKKPFLDRFIISQSNKWKATFDIWMLLLVGYSCFTSIFQQFNKIIIQFSVSFDQPTNMFQVNFDIVVEAFFWLDLALNFLQEFKDPETYQNVRDIKSISKKYILKLPRLIRLIDISRFNQMLKSFFENSSRDERIVAQYMMMYAYKIFRLVIIAIIITYFIGCFWFLVSNDLNQDEDIQNGNTFVKYFELDQTDNWRQLIVSCYFALTTLATVGYGDYYPISNLERIIAVFIMLCGVAFFSYIMGSFIEIISNYEKKMGVIDKGTDLHNWMTLLTRFTNNKPLPKSLSAQIENHFGYFWANDRLASLSQMFFNTQENRESRFLYDVSFGFMPRKFEPTEEDKIIYDEEEEVPEMYFIVEGQIGIGYSLIANGISRKQYKIAKKIKSDCIICDHYVANCQKSQFIYIVIKEVKSFALTKKFLQKEIFPKYPEIAFQIKADSLLRYKRNIHKQVEINKKSAYKRIMIDEKNKNGIELEKKKLNQDQELNMYMKEKIDGIQKEISKFTEGISCFAQTCDEELNKIIQNLDQSQNFKQ
ncbi:cation channel family protein [Stylonychia lemnae]|uniref:Cation channel family protein n=1 Tax=Stylonychia lemnae TaxID=5949 RepID=A0A078AX99_STYLE|nr:cation channel family protein [Stylonychia lemnae]|eukprot:CDW87085.1 cation channel family protein [Stylonychia lemnae]